MKAQLKPEYAAFSVLGILAFSRTEYSLWWFAAFFAPDLSMLGYLSDQ